MKRILFAALLMLPIIAFGQNDIRANRIIADQSLMNPVRDTVAAPGRVGEQRFRVSDNSIYVCISMTPGTKRWERLVKGDQQNQSYPLRIDSAYVDGGDYSDLYSISTTVVNGSAAHTIDGNNIPIWYPDGAGIYPYFYVRDFSYLLDGRPDMVTSLQLDSIIGWVTNKVTTTGTYPYQVPDHIDQNGTISISSSNALRSSFDNNAFLINLVYQQYLKGSTAYYVANKTKIDSIMTFGINYSSDVGFIPDAAVGAPAYQDYGFTDSEFKSGFPLFGNLMIYQAFSQLSLINTALGNTADAATFLSRATTIKTYLNTNLYVPAKGLYKAATIKTSDRYDIWGSAFAVYLGVAVDSIANKVSNTLASTMPEWYYRGGVRHIALSNEATPGVAIWDYYISAAGLVTTDPTNTATGANNAYNKYQNGGYWTTPFPWVFFTISRTNMALSQQMFKEATSQLRYVSNNSTSGLAVEWWNQSGNLGAGLYVASITMPLLGTRQGNSFTDIETERKRVKRITTSTYTVTASDDYLICASVTTLTLPSTTDYVGILKTLTNASGSATALAGAQVYVNTSLKTFLEVGETITLIGTLDIAGSQCDWVQVSEVVTTGTGTGAIHVFQTAPTFITNITTPKIIGGPGTSSTLTYQATAGIGVAGADHIWLVGNSAEAMRILNSGNVGIGVTNPATYKLAVDGGDVRFSGGTTGGFIIGGGTAINLASDAYVLATGSGSNNAGFSANRPTTSQFASFDMFTGANTSTGWSMQMQGSGTSWELVDRVNGLSRISVVNTGAIKFNAYGAGTFTGTATKFLAVDATGNVIEQNAPGGSPGGAGGNVQTNDGAGGFAGSSSFHYDGTALRVGSSTAIPSNTNLYVRGTGSSAAAWKGRIVAGGDNVAFLLGEYNSQAWLGGHNAALNAWADVYINPDGAEQLYLGNSGAVGNPIITVDNNTSGVNIRSGFTIAAAAGSRKMVVGNGTNFVASTETWAVPGTTGNVLTSDGTNWTSAAGFANYIGNGTYTPTLTNTANLDGSTSHVFTYHWIKDPTSGLVTVTVAGYVNVDPTTTLTDTQLRISVPINTNFVDIQEAGGNGNSPTIAAQSAGILAVVGGNNVVMQWKTTDVTNQPMQVHFTYKVTPP